jgi:hypothetical protein
MMPIEVPKKMLTHTPAHEYASTSFFMLWVQLYMLKTIKTAYMFYFNTAIEVLEDVPK